MIDIYRTQLKYDPKISESEWDAIILRCKELRMVPYGLNANYFGFQKYGSVFFKEHWQTVIEHRGDIDVDTLLNETLFNSYLDRTLGSSVISYPNSLTGIAPIIKAVPKI